MSVEAWVVVDQTGSEGGFLCAIEDNGEHHRGWMLGHRGGLFCFGLATEGSDKMIYLTAPTRLRTGRWYHVAGVYDGLRQKLFVDGRLVAESEESSGSIMYDDTHQLVAGAVKDSKRNHELVGALYEVRLYERVLGRLDFERRVRRTAGLLPAASEGFSLSGIPVVTHRTVLEMQPAIDAAIDRGTEWLLGRQHRDGSWEAHMDPYRDGMTALATYTLLKQGLPPSHPAVISAFEFLRARLPVRTYSAGCLLLALAATKDPANAPWAQEVVDLIVEWEHPQVPGGYSYPNGAVDLSCTQYAALGLWAASKLGVEAPKGLWQRMVLNACDLHQEEAADVDWDFEGNRSGTRRIAGFTYKPGNGAGTGSMTTAGLYIIGTAYEVLGDGIGRKVGRVAERSRRLGLDWLDANWSVKGNPGQGGGRHLYYLYGLERVGAIFDLETIGEHEWYREGAEELIKRQGGPGDWSNEPDTCFALLFLSRATASATGPGVKRKATSWSSKDGEVFLQATGRDDIAMWITGFADGVIAPQGLRILKVEYLADDEVIATVDGSFERIWRDERFAVRHTFHATGKHTLRARVHIAPFDGDTNTEVLESKPLPIEVSISPEDWMRRQRVLAEGNQLQIDAIQVTASTPDPEDKAHRAERALDGLEATRWLCAPDDASPWIKIELRSTATIDAVRISPAASALHLASQFDRVSRVQIVLNGRDEFELELPVDGVTSGVLRLEKPAKVRQLEIRLLDRSGVGEKRAGLAEVTLIGKPVRKRRGKR